jgi:hypothetical protein
LFNRQNTINKLMPNYSLQDLENILINFKASGKDENRGSIIDSWTPGSIETPFDIKPEEFLAFAEVDLKIDDNHHLINCLSNIKRAIECQIDSLLIGFGLFEKAKNQNWNFPKKIQILNEIGIVSPRILNKINKLRNLLEHEYSIPQREKVEDALDVAILFIKYTNKFLYDTILDFTLNADTDIYEVVFDYKNSKILFEFLDLDTRKKFSEDIDQNHHEYLQYLMWYIKILDLKERTE